MCLSVCHGNIMINIVIFVEHWLNMFTWLQYMTVD